MKNNFWDEENPSAKMVTSDMKCGHIAHGIKKLNTLKVDICCHTGQEVCPNPRTSVGNNLSNLSKHHPDLNLSIVEELVAAGDGRNYWIAYRACRN